MVVLLICLLNFSVLWEERKALTLPRIWKISLVLWALFLGIGLLSTLHSPFPLRSLVGQNQMGDGWLYWLVIASFTLSNALLLRLHPELLLHQLVGLLIGGVIVAFSVFPQVIDWHIDYTATTGQLIRKNILASTIFQNQQPIGLYSHRGHAAFVLAVAFVLALVALQWKWISPRLTAAFLIPIVAALLLTQTRAAIVALVVAITYWAYRSSVSQRYRRVLLCAALVSLLFVGAVSVGRQVHTIDRFKFSPATKAIRYLSSDRAGLWEQSLRGISKRPLFGWGFDGFGTAYPYVSTQSIPKVVHLGDFSFDYLGNNGQLHTMQIPTAKAHNLILDTTLSVGILGLLSYLILIAFAIKLIIQSSCRGIEAVAIAYFAFTFTWFECAQFAHLAWWALSLWGVSDERFRHHRPMPMPDDVFRETARERLDYSRESVAVTLERRGLINRKFLVFLSASFLLLFASGILALASFSPLKVTSSKPSALFLAQKDFSVCGSKSSGPKDNPITSKYGFSVYDWTNSIKWSCVYNIDDFKGDTVIDQFNSARDAALANEGGVVYFPAGTYQFYDSIYLKDSVIIRGETPRNIDAKLSDYRPTTKFVFPEYKPVLSGSGTPNTTAFKKILTKFPNSDSDIGLVNVDINRAGINLDGNIDSTISQNIIIYGVRSNNVADPSPNVPDAKFQDEWMRYSYAFTANIKVNARANVLISNNRLNDEVTDNYEQPNYKVKSKSGNSTVAYASGNQVPFDYVNHYGIVVNRSKAKGWELAFAPAADPTTEPGLFRKGIVIRDNWVYHTMRAGIQAAGDGLVIKDNDIRDQVTKQWWTDWIGTGQPVNNQTFENRAIDWAGWNVLIEGNHYQAYRHQLMDSKKFSNDAEGILIQECCGGTTINQAIIRNNVGNAYIGLYKTPFIRNVSISENELLSNDTNTTLIYVDADTNKYQNSMDNVRIENNIVSGNVLVKASQGGSGNVVKSNMSKSSGFIEYSPHITITGNTGFVLKPMSKSK